MKKIILSTVLFCSISVLGACSTSSSKVAPGETPATQPAQQEAPTQEELMAKWKEYSTPGEEHKVLNALIGTWNYDVEFYMDPASPPEKSKGKSTMRWIMGGRFVEHNVSGKSMGQAFNGLGYTGYDKATKQYRTVWFDSMGTGLTIGTSKYDPATRTLTDNGQASCPLNGTVPYRAVTTFIDDKHFRYEMFMSYPGSKLEAKIMNIEYTKKK